jgi:hypothetical protein
MKITTILVAAATLSGVLMGHTAVAGPRKTLTCEGTLKYHAPESRYEIGYYKIETKAAPEGGCWFNDNEAPKGRVLSMCNEGSSCKIEAYGECELPTIVEKATPPCPSLHIERVE